MPQQVLTSHAWTVDKNQGNTFRAGKWYTVQEDIFNMDNWEYDGER